MKIKGKGFRQAIATLFHQKVNTSLIELKRVTQKVNAGDFSERIKPKVKGEIKELNEEIFFREQKVEQLSQMNADLKESLQEKTTALARSHNDIETLLSSISNDLAAPLRHISGFAAILKNDVKNKLDSRIERDIQIIVDSTKNLEQMIEDLINYSKLGRRELEFAEIDMNDLLQKAVNWHRNYQSDRKIVWKIRDLPSIKADPILIQMVFSYLLSNAVKFTKNVDPAEIEIGGILKDPNTAVFYVKDNGIGFSPCHKEKLFGLFQRLHSGKEFEGNGIGLANVSQIIRRHGGSVWANGEPGKGAVFYFTLRIFRNRHEESIADLRSDFLKKGEFKC